MEAKSNSWAPIVLSMLERVASRGSAALLMLLLALISDPVAVGQYAAVILSITIYQALADGVIRQIGVEAWNYRNGRKFLRQCARFSGALGTFIVLCALVLVVAPSFSWPLFLKLLPLVFVPSVSSLYLELLTRSQKSAEGWRLIAKSQMWASLISIALAVPLISFWDIGAAALQLLVSDVVFLILIHHRPVAAPRSEIRSALWRRFYLPTALSSILGWSQSQLERLILVLLSSPGPLGVYSLSVAIARSASDAITSGLVNAIRSQISAESETDSREWQLRRGLVAGMTIALAMQIFISLVCIYVLPLFLEDHWAEAIRVAPVFACTGVFAAVIWVTSSFIITSGRADALLFAQVTGVLLSAACGIALNISLAAGAFVCVFRDAVGLFLRLFLIRHSINIKFFGLVIMFLLASVGVGAASFLLA